MNTPKNKLHVSSLTHTREGIKMPFPLHKPLKEATVAKKLHAAFYLFGQKRGQMPHYKVAKIKMCNPTFGYATFAPVAV